MSMRKQHPDSSDKQEILNRSVRPSSFKLFEKRQLPNSSPQASSHSRPLNQTTHLGAHHRSRAESITYPTNPTDNLNCFGGVVLPTVCSNQCEARWKAVLERLTQIESKLELSSLKFQESRTDKQLEATKQLETFNRLINLQKRSEKVEYTIWEMREFSKADKQESDRMGQRIASISQQLAADFKFLQQRIEQLQLGQNPEDLRQRMESARLDQNRKLKSMYEALEDMGNLQASMVETVNCLKMQLDRGKDEALCSRSPFYQQNKQNLPKFNTVRLDSQQRKGADRKNSYY